MNPHFRRVAQICFQNAVIVADRYHVVRQVYWAMERVRKTEQTKLSKRLRKYFKKSRSLLSKSIEKLTEEEMNRLSLMFEIAPRLADAYRLKNEFLSVIRTKSSADRKQKLLDWLQSAEICLNFMTAQKHIATGFTRSSILWMYLGQMVLLRAATTRQKY